MEATDCTPCTPDLQGVLVCWWWVVLAGAQHIVYRAFFSTLTTDAGVKRGGALDNRPVGREALQQAPHRRTPRKEGASSSSPMPPFDRAGGSDCTRELALREQRLDLVEPPRSSSSAGTVVTAC